MLDANLQHINIVAFELTILLCETNTYSMHEKWHPPISVITVFEKNGFCWGGRWKEFDNIHFEANALLVSNALNEKIENIIIARR